MCGIITAFNFGKYNSVAKKAMVTEATIFVVTQLLQKTVTRGKDATGVAILWDDGNFGGMKMGIPSPDFIARFGQTKEEFGGLLKSWRDYPKRPRIVLGHCRKASVGNSWNNDNNHPITVGDTIVIHNGTLNNHDIIFKNLGAKPVGDVDSEAIAVLIDHITESGKIPFSTAAVNEVAMRLDGTFSVVAVNANNPFQAAMFRDGKPAVMALVRPLETVFVASEKDFLASALFELNKYSQLYDPALGIPMIKKEDVEMKDLPNDSAAVWDLTAKIDKDTSLSDLYDWEKLPLIGKRLWKAPTKVKTYNAGGTAYGSSTGGAGFGAHVNVKKKPGSTTQSKTGTPGHTGGGKNSILWTKAFDRFKTQKRIDSSSTMGAVEIDVVTGKVESLAGNGETKDAEALKEKPAEIVEKHATGTEIKELGAEKVKQAAAAVKKGGDAPQPSSGNTVSVDMTKHPEAVKAAKDFVNAGVELMENEEELLDLLGIESPEVLKALPLFAIANKIKRAIAEDVFAQGFSLVNRDTTDSIKTEPLKGKLARAEKKIRLLKLMVRMLGNIGEADDSAVSTMVTSIKQIMHGRPVSDIFSSGEMKNIPILKRVAEEE